MGLFSGKQSLGVRAHKYVDRDDVKKLQDMLIDPTAGTPAERRLCVEARDKSGRTPLIAAARKGSYAMCKLLIQAGAKVNAMSMCAKGGSALHECALNGCEALAKLLLDVGGDPYVENVRGYTALDYAIMQGHVTMVRLYEQRALFTGWLCFKVSRYSGLSTQWKPRYVTIFTRTTCPLNNSCRSRPLLVMYKSSQAFKPCGKVWLDAARAHTTYEAIQQATPRATVTAAAAPPHQTLQCNVSVGPHRVAPDGVVTEGNQKRGWTFLARPACRPDGPRAECEAAWHTLTRFTTVVNGPWSPSFPQGGPRRHTADSLPDARLRATSEPQVVMPNPQPAHTPSPEAFASPGHQRSRSYGGPFAAREMNPQVMASSFSSPSPSLAYGPSESDLPPTLAPIPTDLSRSGSSFSLVEHAPSAPPLPPLDLSAYSHSDASAEESNSFDRDHTVAPTEALPAEQEGVGAVPASRTSSGPSYPFLITDDVVAPGGSEQATAAGESSGMPAPPLHADDSADGLWLSDSDLEDLPSVPVELMELPTVPEHPVQLQVEVQPPRPQLVAEEADGYEHEEDVPVHIEALSLQTSDSPVAFSRTSSKLASLGLPAKSLELDHLCVICLAEPKSAGFVHGSSIHLCCCQTCALDLKGRGEAKCPICRQEIEHFVMDFYK